MTDAQMPVVVDAIDLILGIIGNSQTSYEAKREVQEVQQRLNREFNRVIAQERK